MNFDFSDEQQMLRDEVRKYLVRESPTSVARRLLEHGGTHDDAVWRGLSGLGATALMLPEDVGGAGLGALELCIVAEEVGRQLAPVPLASTSYLALQALLLGASPEQQRRWLPLVVRGAIGAWSRKRHASASAGSGSSGSARAPVCFESFSPEAPIATGTCR